MSTLVSASTSTFNVQLQCCNTHSENDTETPDDTLLFSFAFIPSPTFTLMPGVHHRGPLLYPYPYLDLVTRIQLEFEAEVSAILFRCLLQRLAGVQKIRIFGVSPSSRLNPGTNESPSIPCSHQTQSIVYIHIYPNTLLRITCVLGAILVLMNSTTQPTRPRVHGCNICLKPTSGSLLLSAPEPESRISTRQSGKFEGDRLNELVLRNYVTSFPKM